MTMAALLAGITLCGVATAVPALAATPAPLAVATTYLPPGTANTSYSAQLAATGGTKPYDWTISTGALPAGLTLHPATGAITGKPTVTGPASFTVSVTDSESTPVTASATESITVTAPPLTVTTTSLPTATADAAYKATLAATGGVAPYTWLLSGGALPDGLTLHTNGTVSGTPKVAGTFSFTAEVADSDSPTETASAGLSITVAAAPLAITTDSMLPSAQAGTPYSVKLSADGGITPYTWSVISGALPYGVTLHSNGTISGTPAGDGTFSITVQVTDSESPTATADQVFTLVVPAPLAIATTALPDGAVGDAYSAPIAATGGAGPYTWSITSGTLPSGVTLGTLGSDGLISGTPQESGTYTFTVQVTDSENPAATATETFAISIAAPSLAITTTSLPGADEGVTYSATLSATGGAGPYTWTVTSGFLPDGLTLDTSTGVIGGTVLRGAGSYTVTIEVSDSENPAATAEQTLTLDVIPSPVPIILTQGPLTAVATTPYSQTLEATGGVPPYTWSVVSGSLPTGLSLDSSTGAISGAPQEQGTYNFTIQAADSGNPPATITQAYTMTVTLPPLAITTTSLPTAVTGNYNSATLTATGGLAPYTWTLASGSSLPPGLTLDSSAGVISGTPTMAGSYTFTIQTADSENPPATITQAYTLVVAPHVAITTTTLPDGALNTDYLATLTATGGVAPYTWTLAVGSSLPPGLTLDSSTGVLAGIPTAPEVYTFTIRATDSDNPLSPESAVQTYTIVVSG
jgi:hypothetical protein